MSEDIKYSINGGEEKILVLGDPNVKDIIVNMCANLCEKWKVSPFDIQFELSRREIMETK